MELVHAIQKLPTLPHDTTRPQQLVRARVTVRVRLRLRLRVRP